jgi:hypothetical protein
MPSVSSVAGRQGRWKTSEERAVLWLLERRLMRDGVPGASACPGRRVGCCQLTRGAWRALALADARDYQRLPNPARDPVALGRRVSRLSTAVVHLICNQGVAGSNPAAGTRT